MIIDNWRKAAALVCAWLFVVGWLLSFEEPRRNPFTYRTIVEATAFGIAILVANHWNRWNKPPGANQKRSNHELQQLD